jgi:hypothetical protein
MSRPSLNWPIIIVVVMVLVAGIGGVAIWLKIADLKEVLVKNLESSLGARVEVASLNLDFWNQEILAAGISLENTRPEAPWQTATISQAILHFHLRDIFAESMPLTVDVSSWNIALTPLATASAPASTPSSEPGPSSETTSNRIKVTHLSAQNGEVTYHLAADKTISLHGVAFESEDNGAGVWTTDLHASGIEAGSLQAGTSSVQIRGDKDKVTISKLLMQCADGFLSGEGETALNGAHATHLALKATDIPVSMLVGVKWQMKLSGLASGDLTYDGDDQNGSAHGHLDLDKAKFNVLPWLGKVTLLVGLPDITDVEVDVATTDVDWKNGALTLSNLDIRKNDVVRIAGTVTVDPKSQVDGKLKLGLPSTVTAKWPALQDKVFSAQLGDYNWADVHLTGTPDQLQEDLTPRLVNLGTAQGTDLLNQTTQKALDLFKSFLK